LTLALPALLLVGARVTIAMTVIDPTLPDELMLPIAAALLFMSWLAIAFLQFRLLKPYLRRPRLWFAATIAGGIVGTVAGASVQILFEHAIDRSVLNDVIPAWAGLVDTHAPSVIGSFVTAGLLSLWPRSGPSKKPWVNACPGSAFPLRQVSSGRWPAQRRRTIRCWACRRR
jgi:hypothetical protein